jgi:hypothetical protein
MARKGHEGFLIQLEDNFLEIANLYLAAVSLLSLPTKGVAPSLQSFPAL